MTTFDLGLNYEMLLRLTEIKEKRLRQRARLMLERERVRLCRELRHARARLEMRRAFSKEVEAATRPFVESVGLN